MHPKYIYEPTIDKAALKYAEEKLGETEKIRDRCVKEITNWIISSKSDFNGRTDYYWILSFLRACKFDLEKTKIKIKTYLKFRAKTPEWYSNRDPLLPDINDLLQRGVFLPLHGRDSEGCVVIIIRMGAHLPHKHSQSDLLKAYNMILEALLMENEDITVYGLVVILDMSEYTFQHMLNVTPGMIHKGATVWQYNCFRPQGIHMIYATSYMSLLTMGINMMKQFLSKKIKERIHIHNGSTNITEIIPKEILPAEYGGTAGNVEELSKYWMDKCLSLRDWFREDETYKAFL